MMDFEDEGEELSGLTPQVSSMGDGVTGSDIHWDNKYRSRACFVKGSFCIAKSRCLWIISKPQGYRV